MRYYMLSKPMDKICAVRDPRHRVVMECIAEGERAGLYPVGRLDKDTEGLLILTDDGEFTNKVLSPSSNISKTYLFYAKGELTPEKIAYLESPHTVLGGREFDSSGARVEVISRLTMRDAKRLLIRENQEKLEHTKRGDILLTEAKITISEGKKHQVKRMLLGVGCEIVYLKRLSIGALALDETLAPGEYRPLTSEEIALALRSDK